MAAMCFKQVLNKIHIFIEKNILGLGALNYAE